MTAFKRSCASTACRCSTCKASRSPEPRSSMNRSHGGLSGLLAALLLACLTAHAEPVDRARFSKLSLSLVKIEASDRETHLSLGSGVVVAPEHVVTNCHVTR